MGFSHVYKPRKDVIADAKKRGVIVHLGYLIDRGHETNSELELTDPNLIQRKSSLQVTPSQR